MAGPVDTNNALGSLNWAAQMLVGGVAGTAPPQRVKKTTKREREAELFGSLFPLATIQDGIEEGLKASIREAIGTLNSLLADNQIQGDLQKLLGQVGDRGTIAHSLKDLTDAFAQLADAAQPSPEAVLRAADTFTEKLKDTTRQIQALRGRADSEIGVTVDKANVVLKQIAELNGKIALNAAIGVVDQEIGKRRDSALSTLAGALDFASFNRDDGTVWLFTKSGTPLVNAAAATLRHRRTATIDPSMTTAKGDLSGVSADGMDIGAHLTAGTLHALLQTRDITLPNVQNQLDTLAQTLLAQLNQVSNRAISGSGAYAAYHGSRRFAQPGDQRISLSGGDTVVTLTGPIGGTETSLSVLMQRYRQANGAPAAATWPVAQVAAALNQWISRQAGSGSGSAEIDTAGRLTVTAPQGTTLMFADRRSLALQSSLSANADKSLGLTGPLTFIDGIGNRIASQPIAANDGLSAIAAKLNATGGLSASLVPGGQGMHLLVAGTTASDMTVEPDPKGANVAASLSFLPAVDQPSEDVVVNFQSDRTGQAFVGAPLSNTQSPLGISGALILRDAGGALVGQTTIEPGLTLKDLAARINDATAGKASASIQPAGNRFTLRLSAPVGQRLAIDGAAEALQTSPSTGFAAAGGSLALSQDGAPLGRIDIKKSTDLTAIAEAVNDPKAGFAGRGIRAEVIAFGTQQILEIANASGLPLTAEGTAAGSGPGLLDLRLNARDSLGLAPAADQVVSGFANFFGLNDIFVAEPSDAFDAKAPIGMFTSTAVAGTARALALHPVLRTDPKRLTDASTARGLAERLHNEVNMAAAGGLPRGSLSLVGYAEKIVSTATASSLDVHNRLAFQQTLLDSLSQQQSSVSDIDINEAVGELGTYQQAFEDSSRIVSTMSQLFSSLGVSVH